MKTLLLPPLHCLYCGFKRPLFFPPSSYFPQLKFTAGLLFFLLFFSMCLHLNVLCLPVFGGDKRHLPPLKYQQFLKVLIWSTSCQWEWGNAPPSAHWQTPRKVTLQMCLPLQITKHMMERLVNPQHRLIICVWQQLVGKMVFNGESFSLESVQTLLQNVSEVPDIMLWISINKV